MTVSKSGGERNGRIFVNCFTLAKQDCTTLVTCASNHRFESKMTPRLRASIRTFFNRAPRLVDRLITLLVLGPGGVKMTTSNLELFSCRKFLDIEFLTSVRQEGRGETSVLPGLSGT